ncbi:MAG TPA: hypothetical protein VIQ00_11085 [Chitinophagaceae bacterium]
MKPNTTLRYCILIFTCYALPAFCVAQNIDWDMDTVSQATATGSHGQYVSDQNGSRRKSTSSVAFSVDKLNTVVDHCKQIGINDIKFMIVTLRSQDIQQYSRRYPGMDERDKRDLVGRQALIIEVPREAFPVAGEEAKIKSQKNSLTVSLLSMGLIQLDGIFETSPATRSIYFSIGVICPPPTPCD